MSLLAVAAFVFFFVPRPTLNPILEKDRLQPPHPFPLFSEKQTKDTRQKDAGPPRKIAWAITVSKGGNYADGVCAI